MLDFDTQKELPKEIVSPTKALEVAIHMEKGAQNQQKLIKILTPTSNQKLKSTIFKALIAPRTTDNNGKILLATQLSHKTTNITEFAQIEGKAGVTITVI